MLLRQSLRICLTTLQEVHKSLKENSGLFDKKHQGPTVEGGRRVKEAEQSCQDILEARGQEHCSKWRMMRESGQGYCIEGLEGSSYA